MRRSDKPLARAAGVHREADLLLVLGDGEASRVGSHPRAGVCPPGCRQQADDLAAVECVDRVVMAAPAAAHASVQASATPSSPSRCWMKETRSRTPAAIRSWSICHSCFISEHRLLARARSPASSASIARSIVGRESCSSSSGENQRSVIVPSFDGGRRPIVTERRRALVTGAARGIGAAISARLAADGLEVVRLDLHEGCDIAMDVARDEFPPLGRDRRVRRQCRRHDDDRPGPQDDR